MYLFKDFVPLRKCFNAALYTYNYSHLPKCFLTFTKFRFIATLFYTFTLTRFDTNK